MSSLPAPILRNSPKTFTLGYILDSYDQLITRHHQKGLNLFTMGPKSIRNDELNCRQTRRNN